MKILITGGSGFIGSHLVDHFLAQHHKVVIMDNFSLGRRDFISHNLKNPHFKVIPLDILNQRKLSSLWPDDIDIVFHLAANSDISRGATNPSVDFEQTTIATYQLLQVMRQKRVKKIFYTSGSGVYGDLGSYRIPESHGPLLPVSLYGATKLSAEALLCAHAYLYDMTVWIVRPANIIGPRATHGVVYDFIAKLRKNQKQLTILGDGKQSKSYVYISDVIDAFHIIWQKSHDRVNLFNLGSDTSITVNDIATCVFKEMGIDKVKVIRTGGYGGWKGDVPIVSLDSSKLTRLGWKPKYTSRQAVIHTARALLNRKS